MLESWKYRIRSAVAPLISFISFAIAVGCTTGSPTSEASPAAQSKDHLETVISWDSTAAASVERHFEIDQYCDDLNKQSYIDLYFLARKHARIGAPDSAYFYLKKAIGMGWTNINLVLSDPDFNQLKAETSDTLSSHVAQIQFKNNVYSQLLDSLLEEDQKFRRILADSVLPIYGARSPEAVALQELGRKKDVVHQEMIINAIAATGFPGTSVVAERGSLGAFFILQHAAPQVHQDHLSVIVRAAYAGELELVWLASYYDRFLMREGKSQIFGTQRRGYQNTAGEYVSSTWHIAEPDKVDEYREAFGMRTLADYMKAAECTEIDSVLYVGP